MNKNQYCEVAIEIFLRMQNPLPFDVFVRMSEEKFTKVFNVGDHVDASRVKNYAQKGADRLYIMKKDRRKYISSTERVIRKLLGQENLSLGEAGFAIEELSEQIMFEIYEDGIFDVDSLMRVQNLTRTYVKLLKSDVKVLTAFLRMSREETYMVRHSISTGIIALLLAKADNNANERVLEIICLGGLLHDLGMSKLPQELNDADRKLTAEEWQLIKTHNDLGVKIVEDIKTFPQEVKDVIAQHHEQYNGLGYPRGYTGDQIYYPARVVAIADSFSALTTRRGGRPLFNPAEALEVLVSERGKYDPRLMKIFEGLLAPAKKKSA